MAGKRKSAGILRYLKEAFTFRWNLLFFGGAVVAAALSPAPDVLLPLVVAGELTFLAALTSIPRFQAAIDARVRAKENPAFNPGARKSKQPVGLSSMLESLGADARRRFLLLRKRCLEMRDIAKGVRGHHGDGETNIGDDMRSPGLERLLWVFLRLLVSQRALQAFLAATDEAKISTGLASLENRKKKAEKDGDERILNSLQDSIVTAVMRLDNYRKAESNAEFVNVELDRIEGKISALTEMGVSNQDPDYISSQVDAIADGMSHTEDAIRELQYITGLNSDVEEMPEIFADALGDACEVEHE